MKPMKLKISNDPTDLAKIDEVLRSVNGEASMHTYSSASEILEIAKEAEEKLDRLGLPKKDRAGAIAEKTSGRKVPSAYGYRRIATYIKMMRGSRDWFLTFVAKVNVFPDNPGRNLSLTLTQEQDRIATENFKKGYQVQASSAAAPSTTASDVSVAAA
jgi:hypothetical protein